MGKSRWLVLILLGLCAVARAAERPAADPLDAALEQRIRGKADVRDVEIDASWQREPGNTSVKVWGSGVGIWQNRTQFRLTRDQVVSLLKILSAARVGAMRPPGRSPRRRPRPSSRRSRRSASWEPCRRGGLREHDPEPADKRGTVRTAARAGSGHPLLLRKGREDGRHRLEHAGRVEQAGRRTLAPETFEAVVQRRESSKDAGAGESWLLRVNGLRVSDRLMPRGQAPRRRGR